MCKMYLSLLMPACMSLFHVISIYIERDVCVWKWTYTSQPHGYKEVRNHPSSLGLWGPTFQGVENSRVLCPAANRTWKMMFSTNLNIIWTAYSSLKKQLEHTCKSPLFWLPYKPSFPASFCRFLPSLFQNTESLSILPSFDYAHMCFWEVLSQNCAQGVHQLGWKLHVGIPTCRQSRGFFDGPWKQNPLEMEVAMGRS